ncbi:hypothetical protein BG846_01953 [Streptomyces fradiae ATCC 10745 = DSM 40063]|uniref:Uncharacterized protein n=1 Tax=Streptomyces fradiae ATCC 10745 = DSM 40063 TaxID=1319510 RepID=A0A1Y2NZL0_STRFR|nr:hypothetical protein BG846_01953 [Streptomyces fradiae ATCC 10745 = DSM 40063]
MRGPTAVVDALVRLQGARGSSPLRWLVVRVAGTTGYLLKDAPEDLAAAARTAAAGRTTPAPAAADRLMNRLRTPAPP